MDQAFYVLSCRPHVTRVFGGKFPCLNLGTADITLCPYELRITQVLGDTVGKIPSSVVKIRQLNRSHVI
jgi:hypothetical protein